MVTIRLSPVPILLALLLLLHLDYFGYVNLFHRRIELTKDFRLVWMEKRIDNPALNSYRTQETKEEEDPNHERQRKQLSMFADVEKWCARANYTDFTPLPSPDELAALHQKEEVWDELRNKGFPEIITPFNYINVSEKEVFQGYFIYLCLMKAKYLHIDNVEGTVIVFSYGTIAHSYKIMTEGFFMMSDDATFNFWHTLNLRNVMHPTGITYRDFTGMWWPSPYGKSAVERALMLITDKYRDDLSVKGMWKSYQDEVERFPLGKAIVNVSASDIKLPPSEYKYLWEEDRDRFGPKIPVGFQLGPS
ncbi:hypothetical protein ANCCEY_10330 [Ancylostoma ceylanicum]|uniref:Uncharacterized protein n=1 Tax=Ancylostoma ceylanicum TaxID=53326 RepID=A0A0D6LEQ9_9BILA|nr:hypothetical protein ANCCEY_10330 [Ancylostoma ceylanicum]